MENFQPKIITKVQTVSNTSIDRALSRITRGMGVVMLSSLGFLPACNASHPTPTAKIPEKSSLIDQVNPSPANTSASAPKPTPTSVPLKKPKKKPEDVITDNKECKLVCGAADKPPLGPSGCTMDVPDIADFVQEKMKTTLCSGTGSIKLKFKLE